MKERSARSTFPELENFRFAKVKNHRRLFTHVAEIFLERNIANIQTLVFFSFLFFQ